MPMTYSAAGVVAPAGGTDASYIFFNAILGFMMTDYNAHVAGTADQHLAGGILVNDGAYPLTTARSATPTTLFVEIDKLKRAWLDLVKASGVASDFGTITVPITLLDARNDLRGGLGTGDGTGIPGTTAPNIIPSTIPRRDASGFIPMVVAGQSIEMNRELSMVASATPDNNVFIIAGRVQRPGGGYLVYPGGTQAIPAADAALNRYDAVWVRINASGTVVSGVTSGVAASSPALPDPPDGAFLVGHIYRPANAGTSVIYNYAPIAGGTLSAPVGQSFILLPHHRATGTVPVDGSLAISKVKNHAPSAAVPPSMVVAVAAGQFRNSSGALRDGALASTTLTAPSSPNNRWYNLSRSGTTGALVVTPSVVDLPTPAVPDCPAGNLNICDVYVPYTATAIYPYASVVAGTVPAGQGYLWDTSRAMQASGSSVTATFANVADDANSGTYADDFAVTAAPATSGNLDAALTASLATVTLVATAANKVWVAVNGRKRTVAASVTATWAGGGATGWRYLIADLSASSPGFTLAVHATNDANPSLYQAMVMPLWWDGTSLWPDKGGVDNLDSTQVNLQRVQASYYGPSASLTSVGAYAAISTAAGAATPVGAFFVPPGCTVAFDATVKGYVTYLAANPVSLAVLLDGTTTVIAGTVRTSSHFTASGPWNETIMDEVLTGDPTKLGTYGSLSNFIAPGLHSFTLGYATGAGGGSIVVHETHLRVRVFRAPSAVLG